MAVGSVVTMAARHRLAHVAGVVLRRAAWVTAMQVAVVVSAQHRAAHAGKGSDMPCTYPDADREIARESADHAARLGATVCAMLRCDVTLLDRINYAEAGISKAWLTAWWNQHVARDNERIKQEEFKRQCDRLRASAKAKLTPQEWAVLQGDHHGEN